MDLISAPGFFDDVAARCARLAQGLSAAAREAGVACTAQNVGAMAGMYMRETAPRSFAEVQTQDVERFKRFYHLMMAEGVYLPPSPVEAFFFSSAHGDAEIDATIAAARKSFATIAGKN
jgi:glutamate-1-semialdehyde 2,1-aminomutase